MIGKKLLAIFLLLCGAAGAEIMIQQVLYDPLGTESGGEAVELLNTGSTPVDISGWTLSTDSSAKDATLPPNSIIQPSQTFLIADEEWSAKKDDSSWRVADHEEKLTLGNTDSGLALLSADGNVVDKVGWGSNADEKWYFVEPAEMVEPGKSLFRMQNTGHTAGDFAESSADFQPGIPVLVSANITISAPLIEVSKSVDISSEGALGIRNNGLEAVRVRVILNDLRYLNNTIPKSDIFIDGPDEFELGGGSWRSLRMRLKDRAGRIPGKYASVLRVVVSG